MILNEVSGKVQIWNSKIASLIDYVIDFSSPPKG